MQQKTSSQTSPFKHFYNMGTSLLQTVLSVLKMYQTLLYFILQIYIFVMQTLYSVPLLSVLWRFHCSYSVSVLIFEVSSCLATVLVHRLFSHQRTYIFPFISFCFLQDAAHAIYTRAMQAALKNSQLVSKHINDCIQTIKFYYFRHLDDTFSS